MKTIELSNAKAEALAEYLAPKWADLAMRVATANVEVNTPFRGHGESMKCPAFLRRVKRAKVELSALADVLAGLGATLPAVDRAAIVVPYRSPQRPRRKYSMVSPSRKEVERKRLLEAIRASLASADLTSDA